MKALSPAEKAYKKILATGLWPTESEENYLRQAIMLDSIFNETQRHLEIARALSRSFLEGQDEGLMRGDDMVIYYHRACGWRGEPIERGAMVNECPQCRCPLSFVTYKKGVEDQMAELLLKGLGE